MNKENRWLLIFTGIFLLIGFIGTLSISFYADYRVEEKRLSGYKEFFPKVVKVEEDRDFLATEIVIKSDNVFGKNNELIGNLYTAKKVTESIPGSDASWLELLVGVNITGEVVGIKTINREHTPEYYDFYEDHYKNIKETVNDFKIDSIAGSSISGGVINEILAAVKIAHLGLPELTAYEKIFGEGAYEVIIEDFLGNEIVTEKVEIYNLEDDLVGYAYIGLVISDVHDEWAKDKKLKLAICLNLEGKVLGIAHLINEHTANFYNKYEDALLALSGGDVADLEIDKITDSTRSCDAINEIFNAVKEVINNE